jgi:hypothetical protein
MPSRSTKPTPEEISVWDTEDSAESPTQPTPVEAKPAPEPRSTPKPRAATGSDAFDMEGLMTDFPTARDLERFVFDETGVVLTLKGRANRVKYQVALDVLNGVDVDPIFVGGENPYMDKSDMVPVDPIAEPPARDATIPPRTSVQNSFHSRQVPHTDADFRAQGRRCDVTFRKYKNGMITYDILGPIDQRPIGEKIDKFGRQRPELIKWIDPRSGEQVIQRVDGTLTPMGKRLRAMMQMKRVNNSNFWEVWIDRDFVSLDRSAMSNPWAVDE